MKTVVFRPPQSRLYSPGREGGFSLVEVALALGVMGFALTAIVGMIPVGLQKARLSMEATTGSHIIRQVIGGLSQSDFSTISSIDLSFDDQGMQVDSSAARKIYDCRVTVSAAGLPGSDIDPNLKLVQLTMVSNPGNGVAAFDGSRPTKTFAAYLSRSTPVPATTSK
jgi:uncharacterized protein (TIGR02598 family)